MLVPQFRLNGYYSVICALIAFSTHVLSASQLCVYVAVVFAALYK